MDRTICINRSRVKYHSNANGMLRFFALTYLLLVPINSPISLFSSSSINLYGLGLNFFFGFFFAFYLFLHSFSKRINQYKGFALALGLSILGLVYSVIMSLITSFSTSYNTFLANGVFTQGLYLIYAIILIGISAVSFSVLSPKTIRHIFAYYALLYLFFSVIQFCCVYLNIMQSFYSLLSSIFSLQGIEGLLSKQRISGCLAEPSYVAQFISCFLLPFFIFDFISYKRRSSLTFSAFLFVFSLLSKSSTVYFASVLNLILFLFVLFKRNHCLFIVKVFDKKQKHFILGSLLIVVCFCIIFFLQDENIAYFLRAFDSNDLSWSERSSVIANDVHIFLNHPFGVGNGTQGFYYNEIVDFYLQSGSTEVESILAAGGNGTGAGPFWGMVSSGYGILGILIAIMFFHSQSCLLKKNSKYISINLYNLYFVFIIDFILFGFVSFNFVRDGLSPIMLSIPFASLLTRTKIKLKGKGF